MNIILSISYYLVLFSVIFGLCSLLQILTKTMIFTGGGNDVAMICHV